MILSPFPSHLLNAMQRPSQVSATKLYPRALPPKSRSSAMFVPMDRKGRLILEKCVKNDTPSPVEEHDEDDNGALQAVLKLYDAIKQRNVRELSEILEENCRCGCSLMPFFWSFRGKKQVLGFFSYLMRSLGSKIEIVVQPPTLQNGMSVGVAWRLESNHKSPPLGKGFSFHLCQVYQGRVLIRDVEMFIQPLLRIHLDELVMKSVDFAKKAMEKTNLLAFVDGKRWKKWAICILLSLILALIFLPYLLNNSS